MTLWQTMQEEIKRIEVMIGTDLSKLKAELQAVFHAHAAEATPATAAMIIAPLSEPVVESTAQMAAELAPAPDQVNAKG